MKKGMLLTHVRIMLVVLVFSTVIKTSALLPDGGKPFFCAFEYHNFQGIKIDDYTERLQMAYRLDHGSTGSPPTASPVPLFPLVRPEPVEGSQGLSL